MNTVALCCVIIFVLAVAMKGEKIISKWLRLYIRVDSLWLFTKVAPMAKATPKSSRNRMTLQQGQAARSMMVEEDDEEHSQLASCPVHGVPPARRPTKV